MLSDHVLFRECIFYLREDFHTQHRGYVINAEKQTFSCLSTTFYITKAWEFEDFSIHPSYRVDFSGNKRSLLSFISNPLWVKDAAFDHPHLFGEVLSSLISFVTLRPVKSPRDMFSLRFESLDNIPSECIEDLALTLPFVGVGTGAHDSSFEKDEEDQFINEIQDLISILKTLEEDVYVFSLEVIRLIHLSILIKRDDFGLAYLLIISAIEAVAQKTKKQKSKKHDKEAEWEEKALTDESFKELLGAYKEIRGKDTLTDQFIRFISKYCPVEHWDNIVASRYSGGQLGRNLSAMTPKEIEEILRNAYDHRSRFIHGGEQPPHKSPEGSLSKFFEAEDICTLFGLDPDLDAKSKLSPTYELMLGIAKSSIFNWLKEKAK